MRILIGGASGLVGRALTSRLLSSGHTVTRLVRGSGSGEGTHVWDAKTPPVEAVAASDAVINLSGASIGDQRWSTSYRAEILNSRVDATSALAKAIAQAGHRPTFISMSAVGCYGHHATNPHSETSPLGDSFLAGVCQQWEAAADPAREAGARVVHPRLSMVLSSKGGALDRLLLLYRLGLGGTLGGGKQRWSWITLDDAAKGLEFLIDSNAEGAVNLVAPQVITNAQFNRALAKAVRRPAVIPVPAFGLKLALGGFADELLADQPVVPTRLAELGFQWNDPEIEAALQRLCS